jgi:Flp pilus assembly pilin Flp
MYVLLSRFARDDSGAAAYEYGLIAGLTALLIANAIRTLGTRF